MPDYTQTLVSALEYEGLIQLDKVIRLAMALPNMGEFLATAISALDQVRADQGLPIPEGVPVLAEPQKARPEVSALAAGLIKRAMDGSKP